MKWYKKAQVNQREYFKGPAEKRSDEEAKNSLVTLYRSTILNSLNQLMNQVQKSTDIETLKILNRTLSDFVPNNKNQNIDQMPINQPSEDFPPSGKEQIIEKPQNQQKSQNPIIDRPTPPSLRGAEDRLPPAAPISSGEPTIKERLEKDRTNKPSYFAKKKKKINK